MKIERILCLGAAIAISQFAAAKMPYTNDLFGKLEGTFDHCAQADPPAAKRYDAKKKAMVKDVPESELTKARESDEYKAGYKSVTEELAKMPKDEVQKACTAALESKTE